MHKALLIAHYFPPIGGSGTQRPVKFVKHLPALGWQPYVISTTPTDEALLSGVDKTLLADIPDSVQVWRIPIPRPEPVNRLAAWVGWKVAAVQDEQTDIAPVGSKIGAAPRLSLATRLRRAILSPLYLIQNPPIDRALYWSLRIVPLARRVIEQEQIDVVLTTVPPWSALLAGRLLQWLTGRPWIADFRDPWTDNTFIYSPSAIEHRANKRLERYLINHADAVVSVTEPWVAGLREKASPRQRNKPFELIPNGWDEDDFPHISSVRAGLDAPANKDGRIVLLHPGSAYQGEPLPLLAALDQLANRGINLDGLFFHFVGYVHPEDQAVIANSPHRRLFQHDANRVPHDEAIRMMREAHVLLLLLRKGPDASSGKIFEYMVSGRPVLTVGAKDGVAANLVRCTGIGSVADAGDVDELAALLKGILTDYGSFVAEHYHPDWTKIRRYEREELTQSLVNLLDKVVQET